MGIWNRALMYPCRNKACDMRHVHHKNGSDFVCNLTELLKVNGSCISACPCNDQFWAALLCYAEHLIIVEESLVIDTVRHAVVIFP